MISRLLTTNNKIEISQHCISECWVRLRKIVIQSENRTNKNRNKSKIKLLFNYVDPKDITDGGKYL